MGCGPSNPCSKEKSPGAKRTGFQPVYEKELSREDYGRRERMSDDSTSYTADKYVTTKDARRILKRQERVVEAMEALQADAALKTHMYPDGEMYGDAGAGIYPFSSPSGSQSGRQHSPFRRWPTNVDGFSRQAWSDNQVPQEHNWVRARDTMPGQQYPGSQYQGSAYPRMDVNPYGTCPYPRMDVNPYGSYQGPGMMPQQMGNWGPRVGYMTPGSYRQTPMVNQHHPQPMYAQPISNPGDPFESTPVYHKQQESSNLDDLLIQSILNDSPQNASELSTKETPKSQDLAVPSSDKRTPDEKSAQEEEKGTTDKDVFAVDFFEPSSSRRTPSKEYNPFGVDVSVSATGEFNPFGVNAKGSQGDISSESSDAVRRREIAREIDDIIS